MNANNILIRVHLSFFSFLYFLFLTHLGITYRRPQGAFFTYHYFTCILLLCTWSPEVNCLSNPWVIVCFSSPSLYLYISDEFTFPNSHTCLFPLNLVKGWPKSQTVPPWPTTRWRLGTSPLQVLIIFSFSYFITHADALCIYVYVSHYVSHSSCIHE